MLLRHALAAGPRWFDATKVTRVETRGTHARVTTDTGLAIDAAVVVFATGAESQLLRSCGLLGGKPAVEHAARVYYEGVEGLSDRVILFFDGVDLPGYGWIFPTSPTSANIGCGVFAQDRVEQGTAPRPMAQARRLDELLATHPMLRRMLANARPAGPVRAYPLRTDFHHDHAGRGRLIVIGEAAGLVNPITGEGIDYALESAEFLAAAFAARWPKPGGSMSEAAAALLTEDYRRRLSRRFTRRFALYRKVQRLALAPERTPALLSHVARTPALQRLVVDGLFGRARPAHLLRPTMLWQMARLFAHVRSRAHQGGID